jgi:myo-inositol 2-dehydrogenase / D-chiro-inositol 1-dehydrogenase
MTKKRGFSRRDFLKGAAAATGAAAVGSFFIVPRRVLGQGLTPPSEMFGTALIGCGSQGPKGTMGNLSAWGPKNELRAQCDVKFKDKADNKTFYTDFRRVLERKDIDIVAIATPPHWHALISIAAMQAGKDVFCEKPMTRFVAEGRAVAEAEKRYGRIFQVGVDYRMGRQSKEDILRRKILTSGLLKDSKGVLAMNGLLKLSEHSGSPARPVVPVPANLDWDMYCGPSPLKPFQAKRFGGTHRQYWDYDGGGLGDMGTHMLDGPAYAYGFDTVLPVEVEVIAPPAHPEVTGMWAWAKLKYASGFTLVIDGKEWGEPSGMKTQEVSLADLSPEDQAKINALPDPPKLIHFSDAVKTRKPSCGNAEMAHKTACIIHLINVAIRVGRKIKFDPVKEVVIGDEEANRLVNQPMRAPWHL